MAELPTEQICTGPGEDRLKRYQGSAAPQGSDGVRNAPHSAQGSKLPPRGRLLTRFGNYHTLAILGEGTYGVVVKCIRLSDMEAVAVKIVKNEYRRNGLANMEVAALQKLKMHNSHKYNLVQFNRVLTSQEHVYLEFELLDKSLLEFMRERHFQPLGLKLIRPIIQQIARALNHMKSIGIIHADLKLENVMLVNHQQEPYRVKVIDFSLACDVSSAKVGSRIQSSSYRSPEIILGAPFTEAIDVWSLGCIAANLFLGSFLYPGSNEYEVMRYIVATQGQPPDTLLDCGLKTSSFFYQELDFTTNKWKLKTPEQFVSDSGTGFTERRRMKLTSLDDLKHYWVIGHRRFADIAAEMCDLMMFVEMLKGMLALDPEKRMTPSQVLEHDFTKMYHITCLFTHSSHVKSCFQKMAFCQMVTSNSHAALCGSLRQPCSQTSQPARQSPPHPPVECSTSTEPHCSSSSTSKPDQQCPSHRPPKQDTRVKRHCPHFRTTRSAQQCHHRPPAVHLYLYFRTTRLGQKNRLCPPAVRHYLYFRTTCPAQQCHRAPDVRHRLYFRTNRPGQQNRLHPPAVCHYLYFRTTCPAQQCHPHPLVVRYRLCFRTTRPGQQNHLRPPAVRHYLYFRTTCPARPAQQCHHCPPAVRLYLYFRTTRPGMKFHLHPSTDRHYLYFRSIRTAQRLNGEPLHMDKHY